MDPPSQDCDRTVELIRECAAEHGLLATMVERDNYHRIWGRDGCILGLAAPLCGDEELLPAFHPVITPAGADGEELQMTFSDTFKNRPHQYHNGGLCPLVTGFYVADLAARGRDELAGRQLDGVHRANALETEGRPRSFPEFLHDRTHAPGGARRLGWSAAAAVIGQQALEGNVLFSAVDRT